MTAGLFSKLNKKTAAEFSFLVSIPLIAAAGALKTLDLFDAGVGQLGAAPLVVGFLSAALGGFAAISILLKMLQKYSFLPFTIYRIGLAAVILWLV